MENSEDLTRKVLNLARQGALSNSERNWQHGPTCRRGKDLEDSGSNTGQRRPWTGSKWAQAGRPNPFRGLVGPPLTKMPLGLFISPWLRATHPSIHHTPPRSREAWGTPSRRWGSCLLSRVSLADMGTLHGRPCRSSGARIKIEIGSRWWSCSCNHSWWSL
jgi:hypothetical protein